MYLHDITSVMCNKDKPKGCKLQYSQNNIEKTTENQKQLQNKYNNYRTHTNIEQNIILNNSI